MLWEIYPPHPPLITPLLLMMKTLSILKGKRMFLFLFFIHFRPVSFTSGHNFDQLVRGPCLTPESVPPRYTDHPSPPILSGCQGTRGDDYDPVSTFTVNDYYGSPSYTTKIYMWTVCDPRVYFPYFRLFLFLIKPSIRFDLQEQGCACWFDNSTTTLDDSGQR